MRLEKLLSVLGYFDDPRRDVQIEFATEAEELVASAFVIDADFRTVSILFKPKPEPENNGPSAIWDRPRVEGEPPF